MTSAGFLQQPLKGAETLITPATCEREAIRQVALLAISTGGYPAAMAAYGWINEVLDREG